MNKVLTSVFLSVVSVVVLGMNISCKSDEPKGTKDYADMRSASGAMTRSDAEKVYRILHKEFETKTISLEDGKYLLSVTQKPLQGNAASDPEVQLDHYSEIAEAFGASNEIPKELHGQVFDLAVRMSDVSDKRNLCKLDSTLLFDKLKNPAALPYLDKLSKEKSTKVQYWAKKVKKSLTEEGVL